MPPRLYALLRLFRKKIRRSRGFALISAIALMALVLGFSIVIVQYVFSTRNASKSLETQIYATQIAEAGLYKALYCLNTLTAAAKCGGVSGPDYSGETNVSIGTGRFSSTVTGTGTERLVTVTGYTVNGLNKALKANLSSLPPYQPTMFSSVVQANRNGVRIYNNAIVRGGTIYSDSDVSCGSNVTLENSVFVSKGGASVSYCRVLGSAYAQHVLYCVVNNNINYVGTMTGSTAYGTITKVDAPPPLKPMPTLDLAYWRERAERGGTLYGNQLPANGASLGPVKIAGNLTLGQGVNITLEGPVWVAGNILMNENSSISLKPSFGVYSTVLLADNPYTPATSGKITVNPNAFVNGSGDPKSFILMASTNTSLSDTAPALDVGNNAGGGIFYAVNGTVRVRNNASATAVAGARVYIDENGIIDYSSGFRDLTDLRLSVLPPGTWRIKESAWREISP